MRDIETIDSELRLVAALRRAARERGGPLPSIDVAQSSSVGSAIMVTTASNYGQSSAIAHDPRRPDHPPALIR